MAWYTGKKPGIVIDMSTDGPHTPALQSTGVSPVALLLAFVCALYHASAAL